MKSSNYNNSTFEEHLNAGKYDHSVDYEYFMEYDPELEFWELRTSLGEDIIEYYSYIDQEEIEQDIEQAEIDFDITFKKI